jgi:hypothetical protein
MTIKIVTEFGDEIFYDLPFRVEKAKSVEFVSRAADPPTIPPLPAAVVKAAKEVVPNWSGLWLSDSGTFVEVVTNEEAYFIRENGTRMVRCSVNRSGMVSIDGGKSCRLIERKRSIESKQIQVKGFGWKTWPEPKGM